MDWLLQNPFALWLAIGAVLLAVEVATGSGWLLWPAASAAVMGVLGLVLHFGLNMQLVIFALLTIVTTLAGRRLFPRAVLTGGDINDTSSRMAGLDGVAAGDFQGR
ncbi:MAG TPA: NfeD family protein, partial [Rhizomicrobium sp.]|nr:NfeD family protein [Rhizomicrobium sp.]